MVPRYTHASSARIVALEDPAVPTQKILDLIGNTPLVEVTRMDPAKCRLFLKMESQNPAGSIKDRIGLSMLHAAEQEGKLKPGGTIIEATAARTGLGLGLDAPLHRHLPHHAVPHNS